MQKLSKQDKNKLAAVKSYLERYLIAKESAEAVDELNTHTKEDLTNPPINGRGYSMRSGNTKSEGAAACPSDRLCIADDPGKRTMKHPCVVAVQ